MSEETKPFYPLGTKVPSFGTIQAIKMGSMGIRDYLLIDGRGTVTWLDELAIDKIFEQREISK